MGSGPRRAAARRAWPLAAAAAVVVALPAPADARSPASVAPPTSAALERSTASLEQRWGPVDASLFRSAADDGGGVDPGLGDGGGADPDQSTPGDGGGAELFPGARIVSYYGAPQLAATVVGKNRPGKAVRKLIRQARPYERGDRPVIPQVNLISTIATASPGEDGLYRFRQPDSVIAKYLKRIRKVDGRLMLDIQPGRARLRDELRAIRPWLLQPDVDLGIDAEWNVGRRGVPGQTEGRFRHREINEVSQWLADLVAENDLPPKALIVHQFRKGSIRKRRKVRQRDGVSVTLNFDGIGGRDAKRAGYKNLSQDGLFNGFSLFYDRDVDILRPRGVLRLRPTADYVMYQ